MMPSKDIAEVVTDDLMHLRQKVQGLLGEEGYTIPEAEDAYVSALIGHLFASLLSGLGPSITAIDKSPEGLAAALSAIGKKLSVVAGSLDRTAEYRIQIFRREKE